MIWRAFVCTPLFMDTSPEAELQALSKQGLRRTLRTLDSAQGPRTTLGAQELVNFSSNDYLGLANHPSLLEAACSAAKNFGFGSGASRLVCGTLRPHVELESALAKFKSSEAALVFGSGFATGTGVLSALLGKDDTVILDKLSHACLIDGARASGATLRVFGHNRLDQLADILHATRKRSAHSRIIVVTESVFSMDGDLCPLAEIVELKNRYAAWLLLDEAHATGVMGPGGRGYAAELGLSHAVDLQMGTLSKALGCHGGFVAASRTLIDLIINRARPFIYATAPPPMLAAAARQALDLVASEEGQMRREQLRHNRQALAQALGHTHPSKSPILPYIVGSEDAAVKLSQSLQNLGILAGAIRYPTVAKGSARIRFTVSSAHRPADFAALASAFTSLNIIPQDASALNPL